MRSLLPLLILALTACVSSAPRGVTLIPHHEQAPPDCEKLASVKARSAKSWWRGLFPPVSHERNAREQLRRRARKSGADTVYITAHRAYRGEDRGEGIVRVELEGQAVDCSGS